MDKPLVTPTQEKWMELLLIHQFGVEELITKLNILNDEFKHYNAYNPIEHISSRLKKPKSIVKKLERLNIEPTVENAKEHLHDIGGIRITCSFVSDIYELTRIILSQKDVKVIEVKDYIDKPKPNGYRSLHLIVSVPVFLSNRDLDVETEIQIRTVAMDFWASLEHKIYYKYSGETPPLIRDDLTDCANIIANLDERMLSLHREIKNYKKTVDIDDEDTFLPANNAKLTK